MQPGLPHARLEARDLIVELPGDDGVPLRVLGGVSLAVAPGDIVDVAGPSGAGKSTLLRALTRLLPVSLGELFLDGRPTAEIAPARWRASVALLPQKPAMIPGDVRVNLLLPWSLKVRASHTAPDDDALRTGLDQLGLTEVSLDRDVARLSVGQQARVALLRVMLTDPAVLLLDEPDAALDIESASAVMSGVRAFASLGGSVIRVRHRETDGLASRRLILSQGTLIDEAAS
jgi:putative ABC transport system ATP-binding protein